MTPEEHSTNRVLVVDDEYLLAFLVLPGGGQPLTQLEGHAGSTQAGVGVSAILPAGVQDRQGVGEGGPRGGVPAGLLPPKSRRPAGP